MFLTASSKKIIEINNIINKSGSGQHDYKRTFKEASLYSYEQG